ncbi:Nn.00g080160.m01.CDS01 [Neocucurbitaria sp. VM-36]
MAAHAMIIHTSAYVDNRNGRQAEHSAVDGLNRTGRNNPDYASGYEEVARRQLGSGRPAFGDAQDAFGGFGDMQDMGHRSSSEGGTYARSSQRDPQILMGCRRDRLDSFGPR